MTISAVRAEPVDSGTLYRTHVRQVARWAGRLGGPTLDVEDIVHEVFAIAHQRLPTFRGDSSVTTWLFGITERVVRHRRRRARWRRWLSGSADESAGHLPAPGPDAVRLVERHETARAVYAILDRLPDRDRQVLILFELEDLNADEVGQLAGHSGGQRAPAPAPRPRAVSASLRTDRIEAPARREERRCQPTTMTS